MIEEDRLQLLEQLRANNSDHLGREDIAFSNLERMGWVVNTALAVLKAKETLYHNGRLGALGELFKVLEGKMSVGTDFQVDKLNKARNRLILTALKLPPERLSDDDRKIFLELGYQRVPLLSSDRRWGGYGLLIRGEGLVGIEKNHLRE